MGWFRFHIELYEADTMHLSCLEDGAYNRLIRHYMKTRVPLPDNDAALANICRLSPADWQVMAAAMRAFFKAKDGKLHHKRCNLELDREDRLAKKRSEHSKNAADKRWSKANAEDAASMPPASTEHAQPMPNDASRAEQSRAGLQR